MSNVSRQNVYSYIYNTQWKKKWYDNNFDKFIWKLLFWVM